MENLLQNKIPISMSWVTHADGKIEPEVHLSIDELIEFEGSITEHIEEFKKQYIKFLKKGEFLKKALSSGNSKKIYNHSKTLYNFHHNKNNVFEIKNYSQAYSEALNISKRYIRNCFDFAKYFSYYDVSEKVPFTFYQILLEKSSNLVKLKQLKKEKQFLKNSANNGNLLTRDAYRERLRRLTSK